MILAVSILLTAFTLSAQVPHHICPLPQFNSHGTGFAQWLRSDNCDRQAGCIPYQNPQNVLVQNSSLVFDGRCLWLNGRRLCATDSGSIDTNGIKYANNGLHLISDTVQLGGRLNQVTQIYLNRNSFALGDTFFNASAIDFFVNDTSLGMTYIDSNEQNGINVNGGNIKNVFIYSADSVGQSSITLDGNGVTTASNFNISSVAAGTQNLQSNGFLEINSKNNSVQIDFNGSSGNLLLPEVLSKVYNSSTDAEADTSLPVGAIYTISATPSLGFLQGQLFIKY